MPRSRAGRRARDGSPGRPLLQRREPPARTLREALGYWWSVAVAADAPHALARFLALGASTEPDVTWVARENRRKARPDRLL